MRSTALLASALVLRLASPAAAQTVTLFDNSALITEPTGGAGGAPISRVQAELGLQTLAYSTGLSTPTNPSAAGVIDDFEVQDRVGWWIESIDVYGLVPPTFLNIYAGTPPWAGGSALATLQSPQSAATGAYRVTSDNPAATTYPILRSTFAVSVWLPAGRYFVEWIVSGGGFPAPAFPPVTFLGQAATGDAMRVGYSLAGCASGCFGPATDGGNGAAQGAPFRVRGRRGAALALSEDARRP